MEPDLGVRIALLGPPGEDGISLALHESPVNGANILLVEHGNVGLENAVESASHVLGADNWSAILLHGL